jgi:hypothetical protein
LTTKDFKRWSDEFIQEQVSFLFQNLFPLILFIKDKLLERFQYEYPSLRVHHIIIASKGHLHPEWESLIPQKAQFLKQDVGFTHSLELHFGSI